MRVQPTRRLVLQSVGLAAAGILLPGCNDQGVIVLELSDASGFTFFDPETATILLDVADLMIPRTSTPGAADTDSVLYLDQLMQGWASRATRDQMLAWPTMLNAYARQQTGLEYRRLQSEQRLQLLVEIDRISFSEDADPDFEPAYRRLKALIFHIHYSSEAANPDYVHVPGQYRGNVSLSEYRQLTEDARF